MQVMYEFSDKIVPINSLLDATNAHKEEIKKKSQARDKEAFKKEFERACKEVKQNDK